MCRELHHTPRTRCALRHSAAPVWCCAALALRLCSTLSQIGPSQAVRVPPLPPVGPRVLHYTPCARLRGLRHSTAPVWSCAALTLRLCPAYSQLADRRPCVCHPSLLSLGTRVLDRTPRARLRERATPAPTHRPHTQLRVSVCGVVPLLSCGCVRPTHSLDDRRA